MACLVVGSNTYQCLWINIVQVLESKRIGGHAGHEEVSRCHTRGESEEFFETQRRHHLKVQNTDISDPHIFYSIKICV